MSESKVKRFRLDENWNGGYFGERHEQGVYDADSGENIYWVQDLAGDCPEDATITRDLMSANDWLEVVNYGIELGKRGYDKAELFELRGEGDTE